MSSASLPQGIGPIVDVAWLKSHAEQVMILDASIAPHLAPDRHIPGALAFDIDGPFSDPESDLPHTMPDAAYLQIKLRQLGLNAGQGVVVYDAVGLYSAPRAWWMLRAAGLPVAVLDGGLPAWEAAGLEVAEGPAAALREDAQGRGDVVVHMNADAFTDAEGITASFSDEALVIDARSRERYAGQAPEPRPGLRTGHIPGARNVPFTELQKDGHLLPAEQLAERLAETAGSPHDARPLITSCGSGVTAAVVALAATVAGYEDVRVYDGSWAEWGRPDPEGVRPIEAGA